MALNFTTSYLEDSLALFRYYKTLAERAMEQVTDEQLFVTLDEEANSIAIVVKHMAGNMRSRWTDFLTTDGEKPDRDRDSEFVDPPATRKALLDLWRDGWNRVFGALEPLSDQDLARTITIRGEPHSHHGPNLAVRNSIGLALAVISTPHTYWPTSSARRSNGTDTSQTLNIQVLAGPQVPPSIDYIRTWGALTIHFGWNECRTFS